MNRHNCLFLITAMGILIFSTCSEEPFKEDFPRSFSLRLKNTAGFIIPDAPVMLTLADMEKKVSDFNPEAFIAVIDGQETASQLQDADQNGEFDHLLFTTEFAPVQEKQLRIYYAPSGKKISTYPKRTQAEISHKVGGRFVNRKYEGGIFQNITYLRVPPEPTDHSSYIRYEGPGWESDKVGYRFYLDWRNATDIFGKKTSDMVLQNVGQDNL